MPASSTPARPPEGGPVPGRQVVRPLPPGCRGLAPGYLLFVPRGFDEPGRTWPLMMFLHGRGEQGHDPSLVRRHGPPALVERRPDFPFVLVSPQCPVGRRWPLPPLEALIDHALEELGGRVDRERIVLTGISLGGYGTWTLAAAYPELFAAIVPVSGWGEPRDAPRLKGIPTWVLHGTDDDNVGIQHARAMIDALRRVGAEVHATFYEGRGHDGRTWRKMYDNPHLHRWLLEQRRPPRPRGAGAPN